ncbi:MAG TPA: glycosyltransferase family 4 protein [Acidimicrobiia bacterium]|nr:glycosyltransferase family 4 protein [Acidimicrobiia bacterium]
MKPKVLFGYRFGVLGGVATQILNRLPEFATQYQVKTLFEIDHGVVARFPEGTAAASTSSEQRVGFVREFAPDLMVVIDSPKLLSEWREADTGGAAVVEVHTTTSNIDYLHELDATDLSGIITVSDYMVNVVKRTEIGRVLPIAVVGNCLGPEWRCLPGRPLSQGPVPVLWTGKLDGHKRALTALEVLASVMTEVEDQVAVRPMMVGGYAAGADRVRHFLRNIMNTRSLRDTLAWLPRVDHEAMPALLHQAAGAGGIALSTTRDESFGMSVAEALVSGCRVVAPAVGALPEIVPSSMLYPDGDFRAATRAVVRMIGDRQHLLEEALEAGRQVRDRMDPAATLVQFQEALARFGIDL